MKFLILSLAAISALSAQTASPIAAMRSKISAGDLLSAESLLDVHKRDKGEDAVYMEGLAWLARGAALTSDWDRAHQYSNATRTLVDAQIKTGKRLETDNTLLAALGASIEVEAQYLQNRQGKKQAVVYLRQELNAFAAPVALRSRLYKRLNTIALEGQRAPEVEGLNLPKAKPVMLFLWASWCGDCKAQAPVVARIKAKYASTDLVIIAPTRLYDAKQPAVEKVWSETYKDLNGIATPINDAIMERYGVSSTPTFVFIDRAGKVRRYLPSRLTDDELSRNIDKIVAP